MRAVRGLLAFLLLTATVGLAQSPLDSADEAYRRGELKQAARLYGQAAEAESDAGQRAGIRVKQAWAFFGAKNRSKAEEALSAAARDNPALDLDSVYYTDAFVAMFGRVKARLATHPSTPVPVRPATLSLAGIRQRLAQAPDSTAVEPLLAELQQLELAVPPASLAELLEVKAEALDRIGRVPEAFEQRGRAGALRTAAQAPPGTSPVPLDTLLEARRLMASGRADDATALLRGVLATLPSSGPALELMGEALVQAGKLDEGVNALRTALLGNEKAETLLVLGEAEFRRSRLPAARESFRRATELD
ncbi:MAG: tetratricopeptide repeat protein, partial [Acidobacteria bacterium]|nr:tetratricopeptide repeat protein [Acidobacteriota bacterium]